MKPQINGIKEQVEQKLQADQKNREFKDAGKRVGGSKKEKAAYKSLINSSDLDMLEKDSVTAGEMVIKDKVYPKVDPEQELDNGVTSGAAFLKTEIRKAFPAKPDERTPFSRKAYVMYVEHLVSELDKCLTVRDIKELSEKYYNYMFSSVWYIFDIDVKEDTNKELLTQFDKRYNDYHVRQKVKELFGKTFYNLFYRSFYKSNAGDKWKQAEGYEAVSKEQEKAYLVIWNEEHQKNIDNFKEQVRKYRSLDRTGLKEAKRNWRGVSSDLETFRNEATNYYNRKLEDSLKKIDNLPENMKQREESWEWTGKKNMTATKKAEIRINSGIPLSTIKRTGGLEITTVTEHEIMMLFGFRGVEFGKYVKDAEAKEHVRHFLGACADLFEIVNYNAIQVNQMNDLSIAFGSRGSGSAAATYYPGRRIINITKSRGDGTVAHEWFHFLDHLIFNKLIGSNNTEMPLATGHIRLLNEGEVKTAISDIMQYFYKGGSDKTKVKARFYPQHKYRYTLKRRYHNEEPETVEEAVENVIANSPMLQHTGYYRNHDQDMKRIFGYIAHRFEKPFIEVEVFLSGKSAYYHYCSQLSAYWTKPWELAARAFETYLFDKLAKANRVNNYLVSGSYFDHEAKVYPQGEEREALYLLYDKLMEAIKTELAINDFVPFTTIRTNEYIELDDTSKDEKVKGGLIVADSQERHLINLIARFYKLTA